MTNEMMTGTLAFNEACQRVLMYCKNGYAKAYAKAGLNMTGREEIRVQSLYILENMRYWRGPEASTVREILKEFGRT
jgi:hypothetical protein